MNTTAQKSLVGAAAAAFVLGLAGPATAATATFEDASGDVAHAVDLQSVRVVNEKNVRIALQHDDLRPSFKSGASGTVFLDTDPSEKGPEYAFAGGYFEGADYALIKTDGWKLRPPGCAADLLVRDAPRLRGRRHPDAHLPRLPRQRPARCASRSRSPASRPTATSSATGSAPAASSAPG